MSSFTPIRDASGGIIGLQAKDETLFAQTLASTMSAIGASEEQKAEPAAPKRPLWRPGRLEAAAIVGGLVIATALIAAMNAFWPAPAPRPAPTASAAPPTPMPTALPTPPAQPAYDAPAGAELGTIPLTATIVYQHSAYPHWGGVAWQGHVVWVQTSADISTLPDLAPPPTQRAAPSVPPAEAPAPAPAAPAACEPTVNPAYVVKVAVIGAHGEPLGSATGVSCVSQEEAQANAEMYAAQVRSTAATADAPPHGAPTASAR
jgi:hypothetical protein